MAVVSDATPDIKPGLGHNNPPADPVFELRRCRVSCDWVESPNGDRKPGRFQSYWRIYRDGSLVDSFLDKANAARKLARLRAEAGT